MDDYGPGSFDITDVGVINATYDLPVARGANSNSWYERVAGNWQISGIETLLSGLPFTPQLSYNPSNDGDSRNPGSPIDQSQLQRSGHSRQARTGTSIPRLSFNRSTEPMATQDATCCADQTSSRRIYLSRRKFVFTERVNLQFRAEFFNIFNHTNFNTPNPVVYTAATGGPSPTAGVITSTSTSSRQIQFGLKLLW